MGGELAVSYRIFPVLSFFVISEFYVVATPADKV